MYAIIGSGFGLYGYLPTIVGHLGQKVALPRSVENKFHSRKELAHLKDGIVWFDDENSALSAAHAVVIAIPPQFQPAAVEKCLHFKNITRYILEKPVAVSPNASKNLLAKLESSKKEYAIGYTFLFTSWQRQLLWPKASSGFIDLTWSFMAHHFAQDLSNWKRRHEVGGGVLRFYGIHVLAMLALHGYTDVQSSHLKESNKGEPDLWDAVLAGSNLPQCRINVNSRSPENRFEINSSDIGSFLTLRTPFENEVASNNLDCRVPILSEMLKSVDRSSNASLKNTYKKTISLWEQAEALS